MYRQKGDIMHVDAINLIDILEQKFEKDHAKVIARAIDEAISESVKQQSTILTTKEDLANLKAEIIKWMFIFWIGQIGILTGIIFAILKLYFS
ncbi:MAG: hypothetical protein SCARUB_01129 [Candidatus Scalindua rubra]|uniref:Uncharacterized protein n=1 Tax=Candidatus Scalindua rubra TaxID=1872076 RepID=A0A1E3XDR9_9BACT|nr:MAG: hypothetical protein SCARUB_01129 [Candidatus Scalindua rubra]